MYMLIVLKVFLLCELIVLTTHFEQLISAKMLCCLLPCEHQYYSVSLQLKYDIFVLSFHEHRPVILNLCMFCVLSFCMALLMYDIFYKTVGDVCTMTYTLQKDTQPLFYTFFCCPLLIDTTS